MAVLPWKTGSASSSSRLGNTGANPAAAVVPVAENNGAEYREKGKAVVQHISEIVDIISDDEMLSEQEMVSEDDVMSEDQHLEHDVEYNVEIMSDAEYNRAEYWQQLYGQDGGSDSSDEDFDIVAETEKMRALYAKKKKQELASKGIYSDDEIEDLFDCSADFDGIDIDDVALTPTQLEKEMSFGKAEDARQRRVKANKRLALVKARGKKKTCANDMDLSDPPSSDGGDDPWSDDNEPQRSIVLIDKEPGRKRRRPKRLLLPSLEFDDAFMHDSNLIPEQMIKGMCFKDVREFKRALQSFHILQGRSFAFTKNKADKVKVHCPQPNCNFLIFASKISGEPTFLIRDDVEPHSCGITREHSRIKSTWLASKYENQFRADPNWRLDAFMEAVKRDLNFEITKRMAYRAKACAQRKVLGDQDKQYLRIRDYMQTLLNKNPGSKAVVDTEPRLEQHLNPRFNGLFISFNAQIKRFLAGCRPFFGLDGCFVKLANGSQFLTACARDGNNNMFVNKEDTDNWTWFLQTLELTIGQGEQHGGWTIMSDRQKGLLAAVRAVFPRCDHRFCKRHVLANFSTAGFKGGIYKEYFDKVVYACTVSEYNIAMDNLKTFDEDAWKWVKEIPEEHISRHAFSTKSKTDLVVNNLSEVFNKYILDYRDKPIVTMLQLIRTRLMTRLCLKKSGVETVGWDITPVMGEKLESAKAKANYSTAYQCGVGIWQVNCAEKTYEVNLLRRTCGCFRFQLCGVPCEHACAAIFKAKEKPEDYVEKFFSKDTYKAAYAEMIFPVPHETEWIKTNSPDIDPPRYTIPAGRPRKNRRKGADEDGAAYSRARKGKVQCGNCRGIGHNMRGCTKLMRSYLALRRNKHVPLTARTQESYVNVDGNAKRPNNSPPTAPSTSTRGRSNAMTKVAASNSKAATAPNVSSARAAPSTSTSTRGRGNATTKAAASNSKAAAAPNVSSAPAAPSTSTRGRGNAANGTGIGRTSAPATLGPNVPARGRGRGRGRAAMQINESQASSSNANAERGGRRPAHSVDAGNKAFGRSSSGRKTSWFTIGTNAAARDAAMKK